MFETDWYMEAISGYERKEELDYQKRTDRALQEREQQRRQEECQRQSETVDVTTKYNNAISGF